jgi:hypothetical protein
MARREDVSRRVAEDDESARVCGDGGEEWGVVGVAADDAVEDDDVGRLDVVGIDGDVAESSFDAVFEAVFAEERAGVGVVVG